MTTDRRDLDIRAALAPAAGLDVPMDLAESIHRELLLTPQERPGFGSRLSGRLPALPIGPSVVRLALVAMLLLGLALAMAIAARPQIPPGLVSSYHGDEARTGVMPGPGPAAMPVVAWTVDLAGPLGALSMPVVRDGVIYVVDTRGTAKALDLATHTTLWERGDLGPGSGSPVLIGTNLYVASDDGIVIALDARTGREAWRADPGAPTVAPLAATGNVIILGGEDGVVRSNGAILGGPGWSFVAAGPVQRAPAIVDGVVYAADMSGSVTAYEIAADRVLWTRPLGDGEVSTPVVADGTVYLTHGPIDLTAPHELVAIDATSGTVVQRWPLPDNDRVFVGAVVEGSIYTVGEDAAIRVLDTRVPDDGLRLLAEIDSPIDSLATVVGDTLYVVGTGGRILALDRLTGAERWRVDVAGAPTMPVVVDGRVIVGTDVGQLIVLEDPPTNP